MKYNGKLFGEKFEFMDWLTGTGEFAENNDNVATNQQDNMGITTISTAIGNIYNWLKQKAEPIINVITPLYKMYKPDSVVTDYTKAINKETLALATTIRNQKSQYTKGFGIDTKSFFGDDKDSADSIYFGPMRLEKMRSELNESVKTVEDYTKKYQDAVKTNANAQETEEIKKAIELNQKVVSEYRESIINMINKSSEIIDDAVAQMDFSYVSKNIDKYIAAQSRTFDKKITSEVFKSLVQDYSTYFATNENVNKVIQDELNSRQGNIRKFVSDYNNGNIQSTGNNIDDTIIRDFVNRLGLYFEKLYILLK